MRGETTKIRVAGIGLLAFAVLAVGLTTALYHRAFASPAEITLRTDRSGLVMDPGNKVKMRGVEIGRVGEVTRVGDGVEIVLEINSDELSRIPADVTAEVRASTVFGAKYVELVAPTDQATARIDDGAVIDGASVTTEVNTVFDSLDRVLSTVNVKSLNSTLTVLARTLEGRGDDISSVAAQANDYLTELEPLLPQLRRDLVQAAAFARLGDQLSPTLLRILRNVTVTGATVVDQQQAIDTLLVDLSILGGRGAEVLGVNGDALATLLRTLRPTTATLRAYAVELPCLFKGLDRTREVMAQVIGGRDAGLRALLTVRSQISKYTAPRDLPTLPKAGVAACHALPEVPADQIPIPEIGEPQ